MSDAGSNQPLQYLIVGTGRSGTGFMSRLFTSVGLLCGHESVFGADWWQSKRGGEFESRVNKQLKAESSWMAVPYMERIKEAFEPKAMIHVVRHPSPVIRSLTAINMFVDSNKQTEAWRDFIYHHMPQIQQYKTPLERAASFYISWNQLIETKYGTLDQDAFFRVEDDPHPLFESLGIAIEGKRLFKNKSFNHRNYPDEMENFDFRVHFKNHDLMPELEAIAQKYGYTD